MYTVENWSLEIFQLQQFPQNTLIGCNLNLTITFFVFLSRKPEISVDFLIKERESSRVPNSIRGEAVAKVEAILN